MLIKRIFSRYLKICMEVIEWDWITANDSVYLREEAILVAPKYLQLSENLTDLIRNGTYPVGSRLPTEAELSDAHHVSRQTVRLALSVLVEKGLIHKKQGSGNRVISDGEENSNRGIAVVVSYANEYIFPAILRDIQNVLTEHNFTYQIFTTNNKVSLEKEALEHILKGSFAGVLVEGVKTALPNPNLYFYQQLRKKKIPMVFFHGSYPDLGETVCVADDNYAGGYQLTRYLISKGHTCIGGIFSSDDIQGRQRYKGYITALHDADLPLPDDRLLWFSTEDHFSILECCDLSLLDNFVKTRLPGCTALVVYNDEIAYQLLTILQKAGYEIPRTMSIVSFDNSFYCNLSPIQITSLSHTGEQTGAVAANLLLSIIRGETVSSVTMPWKLIERKSS